MLAYVFLVVLCLLLALLNKKLKQLMMILARLDNRHARIYGEDGQVQQTVKVSVD